MREEPHVVYLGLMVEIKRRFLAIDRIMGAKKPRLLDESSDNQVVWLQLRQIVELVAFGAIASDQQRYAAKRHGDCGDGQALSKDGKAGKILAHLLQISPHSLPQPMGPLTVMPDGTKHIDYGKAQATLDRLRSIHEAAGERLHAGNPFDLEGAAARASLAATERSRMRVEIDYLKSVLWEHYKIGLEWEAGDDPRALASGQTAWLVTFGKPTAPEVKMLLAFADSNR